MICLDLDQLKGEVKSDGTAFYRLDNGWMEFLAKCEKEHIIIGFEYESGSRNFGVILRKKGK